jgi:hypothetical protein
MYGVGYHVISLLEGEEDVGLVRMHHDLHVLLKLSVEGLVAAVPFL